jgi:hypothetical protein
MSFVEATVKLMRLPHPVVRRATIRMIGLLHYHAEPGDMASMLLAAPDLAELDPANLKDGRKASHRKRWNGRLWRRLRRLTSGASYTQQILQATGLGDDDVAFASAFADYVRQRSNADLTNRILASVPGLAAMSASPLRPYIAHQQPETAAPVQQATEPDAAPSACDAIAESCDLLYPLGPRMPSAQLPGIIKSWHPL